jgi:hypothetical protein
VRKSPPRRRLGAIGLALLAAMILGFLTKRVMIPSAVHYIAYRPPDQPPSTRETNPPSASEGEGDADGSTASNGKSNAGARSGSEQLTPSDRHQLDAIIKGKSR